MTKHTERTEHASWPQWARCWNGGPGSLVWSLSQRLWLMSDYFPTTNYGNNAEKRDEEHNSAAALQNFLIPRVEPQRERRPSSPTGLSKRDNCWRCCGKDELIFFLFSWTTRDTIMRLLSVLVKKTATQKRCQEATVTDIFHFLGRFHDLWRTCKARFLWRIQYMCCRYSTGLTLCNQENVIMEC